MDSKSLVIAAIPAFNEEKTMSKVILLVQKHVDKVVVCDDGSTDLTRLIAERLGAEVIRHERNLGYGAAIQSLFRRARELDADVMVTLDAVRHDPAEIGIVVEPILWEKSDISIRDGFKAGQSGFAAFSKEAIERLGLDEEGVEMDTRIAKG